MGIISYTLLISRILEGLKRSSNFGCHSTIVPLTTFHESNHSHNIFLISSSSSSSSSSDSSSCNAANKTVKQTVSRRLILLLSNSVLFPHTFLSSPALSLSSTTSSSSGIVPEFSELLDSGGVLALDLRPGTDSTPVDGDQVAIHYEYYGRLAAKQDSTGESIPVISVIEASVKSMRKESLEGRVFSSNAHALIIPSSQGYQNTSQEPLPPNFFDRQRLFTTIFNPTRLANGEGSTLGTLIFDIELINVTHIH
ncbi:hypothetical protein RND81_10G247800 [Saponaria officinalis]|uniref:Peptidylprolyl isomerase n=1 Tax=Saponaria officinalis TaxID=3572 RepID=A0AAW1I852_SAPOF